MKRLIFAALLLSPLSLYAVAGRDSLRTVVSDPTNCPADTNATGGPSYAWDGSRFVLEGWICEDKYRGSSIGN